MAEVYYDMKQQNKWIFSAQILTFDASVMLTNKGAKKENFPVVEKTWIRYCANWLNHLVHFNHLNHSNHLNHFNTFTFLLFWFPSQPNQLTTQQISYIIIAAHLAISVLSSWVIVFQTRMYIFSGTEATLLASIVSDLLY